MKSLYQLMVCFMLAGLFASCNSNNKVSDKANLQNSIDALLAGDTLIISNGIWENIQLKIDVKGTKDAPIVISAETDGKVKFTGESFINISGEYVELSGFLFTEGSSKSKPAISFRSGKNVANNCRLTNCAVSYYNPSDRFLKNTWVELYGKNNRVDHCTFTGKLNSGVTLVVKLSGKENQENSHSIDHNFFGPRLRLGSNGGETMRIGTSTYSLTSSNTSVKNNYFEHCSGEVEIVSIKSSDNNISNNTFYECEGVLTLRHGNRNTLDSNVFIGNNKLHTGGIRIINAGHKVRNNHFQELKGDRFRAALPIMNGVPNSAINRYHQVKDVEITNNVLINCDYITFGVGADKERTAIPENVLFANNTLYYPTSNSVYQSLVSTKGVEFKDNKFASANKKFNNTGFSSTKEEFVKNEDGLYASANYTPNLKATKDNTGATWFIKDKAPVKAGKEITVTGGQNLTEIIKTANTNDVIVLVEATEYIIDEPIIINKLTNITADKNLATKPSIQYNKNNGSPIIIIENGGELNIKNVVLNGASKTGYAKAAITTQKDPMINHYNLHANNVDFKNYSVGGASAIFAHSSTFADSIVFENCTFSNISGIAIELASEKEDKGKYNAENVVVTNCLFTDLLGSAIKLYRGGNDESTTGPYLNVDQCTFHNVENRELGSSLNIHGVQWISITNSIFSESGKGGRVIKLEDQNWIECTIDYCSFYNTGKFESYYDGRLGSNVWYVNPRYNAIKKSDYSLKSNSPLKSKSSNNGSLGFLNN